MSGKMKVGDRDTIGDVECTVGSVNGFSPAEVRQTRGPVLEFDGRLLCEKTFETRGSPPLEIVLEIWETSGGALIAASYSHPADCDGYEDVRAAVIPPGGEEIDRHCAVMDFFDWHNHARDMAKKRLGWKFRKVVE